MWVANFEHSRVNTCSLYASPTGLSPYLRFGCLSCRVLYYNLRELYMKVLWKSNTHWCPFALVIIIQYALWPSNLSQFVNSCRLLSPLLFFSSSFLVALHQLRKRCSPPLSLFGQLLWREFFYTAATNNPNFDHMEGNPICVQVGLCITQKKRFPLNSKETCEHKIQTIDRHTALNAPRNFIYAAFWSRRHLCQAFVKLPSQSRTSTM